MRQLLQNTASCSHAGRKTPASHASPPARRNNSNPTAQPCVALPGVNRAAAAAAAAGTSLAGEAMIADHFDYGPGPDEGIAGFGRVEEV